MNWDRILGNWKQLKGVVRQRWGRLTADYAAVVATQAEEKRLAEWLARQHKADPIHK